MTRTTKQNNAFHKYIRLLVDAMIQQDLDMRTAVKIPIQPYNGERKSYRGSCCDERSVS